MRIGRAAALAGLSVKAIRHYESVGLLGKLDRNGAYREFSDADVERLCLIAHCRGLGFSLAEIREVVCLVDAAAPSCPDVQGMLHIVRRRQQITASELVQLVRRRDRLAEAEAYLKRRLAGEG